MLPAAVAVVGAGRPESAAASFATNVAAVLLSLEALLPPTRSTKRTLTAGQRRAARCRHQTNTFGQLAELLEATTRPASGRVESEWTAKGLHGQPHFLVPCSNNWGANRLAYPLFISRFRPTAPLSKQYIQKSHLQKVHDQHLTSPFVNVTQCPFSAPGAYSRTPMSRYKSTSALQSSSEEDNMVGSWKKTS